MAESDRESAELGQEDGREERLESEGHEEAGDRGERLEPEEVEDEEERKEREEYEKQLKEILARLEGHEAAEAEAESDDHGQAGASSAEAEENATPRTPAPAQLAAARAAEQPAALSAGAANVEDQSPAGEGSQPQQDKERGKGAEWATARDQGAETATARDRQRDKEMGEGAGTQNSPPAVTQHSVPSDRDLSRRAGTATPSPDGSGSPSPSQSGLDTAQSSSLAKTDGRMLARRADGLSVAQHRALAMLADGLTIPQAAMKAGVGRATLYRWTKFDPRFKAAYNTWKQEQRESCRAALLKCADAAVARVAQRVEYDEELAFKVIKELGLFKDSDDSATTDPQLVEHEIEIQSLTTERRLQRQHLLAVCEKAGVSEEQAKEYFDWKREQEAGEGERDAETRERVDSATAHERHGDAAREDCSPTQHSAADDDEDDADLDDELDEDEADDENDETDQGGVSPSGGLNSMMQAFLRQGLKGDL